MSNPIRIPEAFVQEFYGLAVACNSDEPLDISLSDDGTSLYLSNSAPGYSPYLELQNGEGNQTQVRLMALQTKTGERIVEAQTAVALDDVAAAAKAALDCWHTTL